MNEREKLVAVISPWEQIHALAEHEFRMESLPTEKKVMVWRDDLQSEAALADTLKKVGIVSFEVRMKAVTNWKAVD